MTRRGLPRRTGFALPAVLWVLIGVAAVTLAGTVAARESITTSQNRVDHARAAWRAEGCLEIARSVIADGLANGDHGSAAWSAVDSLLAASREATDAGCDVTARAAGVAIDVNAADAEQLRRAVTALGARGGEADSLADALLDWRDRDDEPRANGAESAWYRTRRLVLPRNALIADVAELRRIRGFADLPGMDSVFGVEPGRVPLGRAPLAVIASLPGFGDEAVARLGEMRLRGQQPGDLLAFAALLSREARSTLLGRYPELVALVTTEADAWIVTSRAREGQRHLAAAIEVRLVRAGIRAAIVRRRTW
jgi:general secretion pathway protein K